jgi:signal transduction histidine kinase
VSRDVDAAGAVQRSVAGLRPGADAKGVRFDIQLPGDRAALRTDPVRLEQILVNLLSNAVRHTPTGTVVTIAVEPRGPEIHFSVTDHGPGIPPDLHQRIFEPFERFDPQSGLGTGLGLPVSHRLAAVLGGRLTVTSGGHPGARFTLVLPLAPGGG